MLLEGPEPFEAQGLTDVETTVTNETTRLSFTRKLAPGGGKQDVSGGVEVPVIWAYGTDRLFGMHRKSGHVVLRLQPDSPKPVAPSVAPSSEHELSLDSNLNVSWVVDKKASEITFRVRLVRTAW